MFIPYVINRIITSSLRVLSKIAETRFEGIGILGCARPILRNKGRTRENLIEEFALPRVEKRDVVRRVWTKVSG